MKNDKKSFSNNYVLSKYRDAINLKNNFDVAYYLGIGSERIRAEEGGDVMCINLRFLLFNYLSKIINGNDVNYKLSDHYLLNSMNVGDKKQRKNQTSQNFILSIFQEYSGLSDEELDKFFIKIEINNEELNSRDYKKLGLIDRIKMLGFIEKVDLSYIEFCVTDNDALYRFIEVFMDIRSKFTKEINRQT